MHSTTLIIDPTDETTTASNWKLCQLKCCRTAKTDLLSEFVDPAEECHMTLEPDDEKSIALKQQKRRKNGHKRQGSDLTAATEAMSMVLDYTDIDLSFLEEANTTPAVCVSAEDQSLEDVSELGDNDYSCVDEVFRMVLDYPCSDDEEEYHPLLVR